MHPSLVPFLALLLGTLILSPAGAQQAAPVLQMSILRVVGQGSGASTPAPEPGSETPVRWVTQGLADTVIANLFHCGVPVSNHRISGVGTISAEDGTTFTVPAETLYQSGPVASPLFNECDGVTPERLSDANPDPGSIVEIDPDGEVVTGVLMVDNYFELYVNGTLVGVDAIPFTPFNASIVRFRVKRPYTYALKLVDWEEKLGLGMEKMDQNDWHAGDGGFIARFTDGTVTDASWKAQCYYIAPLMQPEDIIENGNIHDTRHLGRVHPEARVPTCRDGCYAVHYPLPDSWESPSFDDTSWPAAAEYTDQDVGVKTMTAYTRYPDAFAGARWIWTSSLVFDNLVLARRTVR